MKVFNLEWEKVYLCLASYLEKNDNMDQDSKCVLTEGMNACIRRKAE